jgi:hypothetical protein
MADEKFARPHDGHFAEDNSYLQSKIEAAAFLARRHVRHAYGSLKRKTERP